MHQSIREAYRPRRLLVCLDLQRLNGPSDAAAEPNAARCIANCRRILAHAREAGWHVAHVYQRYPDQDGRPLKGLEPLPSEAVMFRSGVSAFSSPDFEEMTEGLPGVELVLVGFSLSSSCLATALVAYDRGIPAMLVEDAVSATPLDALGLQAIEQVSRRIAAPFVALTGTDSLTGAEKPAGRGGHLRVVAGLAHEAAR